MSRKFIGILLLFCCVFSLTAQADNDEIDTLLNQMTLEQRVGQMFMVNLFGEALTFAGRDMLETWQPGAVLILDSNITTPQRTADLTNSYQQTITAAGGVPLFVAVDQEGGVVARLQEGFTTFPIPMLLTASGDSDLARRVGAAMALELRTVGVNMNLAPVADLNTNIANPIIGRRSPGTDSALVSLMLDGYIRGMQGEGVMATAKHFPGHGDTSEDSHTTLPVVAHDRARMDAIELPPFIAAMEAGSGAIMTAHIWYSAFEPVPDTPASLSRAIVTDLLRDDLGYEGIIMTDALDMDAIDTVLSPEQAAIAAILAGNDLIAIGAHAGEAIQARAMQAVVDAVRAGDISESRINDSVRRILSAKQRFGVLDWSPQDASGSPDPTLTEPLIREMFAAGITVMWDETGMIPLDEAQSTAIIYPANVPRIREHCAALRDDVQWLAVSNRPSADEIALASGVAQQVERVVVVTRDAYFIDEQAALVNALPPENTAVLALQSVYDGLRFPDVAAYMLTYSPINPAAEVACEVLMGAIPAQGQPAIELPGGG